MVGVRAVLQNRNDVYFEVALDEGQLCCATLDLEVPNFFGWVDIHQQIADFVRLVLVGLIVGSCFGTLGPRNAANGEGTPYWDMSLPCANQSCRLPTWPLFYLFQYLRILMRVSVHGFATFCFLRSNSYSLRINRRCWEPSFFKGFPLVLGALVFRKLQHS